MLPVRPALAARLPALSGGGQLPLVRGHPRWSEQEAGVLVLLEMRRAGAEADTTPSYRCGHYLLPPFLSTADMLS